MKPHSLSPDLAKGLARCESLANPWVGVVFRSASVRYANRDDLLTGMGTKAAGGRWNPPKCMASVYVSLEIETAVQESLAHHRYYGFPAAMALPRVVVSIEIELGKALNLANAKTRRVMGVSRQDLLHEDWRAANDLGEEALTQAIGRLAWQAGWEGLLAPSVAHAGGVNLVILRDNLAEPDRCLKIINADELPPP